MALKAYQRGEIAGVLLVLASTAAQIFYLEPLKREIEWRMFTFSVQQTGQAQAKTMYANQLVLLQTLNAPPERIAAMAAERDKSLAQFQTADANIADDLFEKERVEGYMQLIVIGVFGLGVVLTAFGRAMEMRSLSERN